MAMPAFCNKVIQIDQSDHVWRWRNERAGYPAFARKPWQEMVRKACFDINSLDLIKSADQWDRADANYEQWIDNGRDPIH
jgi:hypothetical protein